MLAGPTGVGKTELARTLAKELNIGFTKLDMSEYQEEYSVSKLIGSAAGYVGYEQSGALTEPLIQQPHQVLLLDEIEKANKSVYDLLLQVFDDGRLTDNHGREASFKNAIILMTTNVGYAGATNMSNALGFTKTEADDAQRTQKAIEDAYKKKFSPEFRNRLSGVCYFHNLDDKVMGMIVDKNIRFLNDSLADKNVTVSLSDNAKAWIVKKAVAEKAGGRPVERLVDSEIKMKIVYELLEGDIAERGGFISVDENNDKLAISYNVNE
jgi:ATP-dependent Clp protease ATP-binding subunit ClpA